MYMNGRPFLWLVKPQFPQEEGDKRGNCVEANCFDYACIVILHMGIARYQMTDPLDLTNEAGKAIPSNIGKTISDYLLTCAIVPYFDSCRYNGDGTSSR